MVGYWKFDEGSGSIVGDSSGNGNNGTLMNSPAWVNGIAHRKALSFDGANTYVRIEDSSSLDVTSQVTVMAWVYPRAYTSNVGNDAGIVCRCDSSGGHIYLLGCHADGTVSYSVNHPYHSSVATIPLNTWTHLAMTYDGANLSLYVNGVLDSSIAMSGPILTTSNWLGIGCIPTGPNGGAGTYAYFNGTIDDVRIYNTALNQTKIQTAMNSVPEFPSYLVVPLFMIATLLAVVVYRRKAWPDSAR